MSEVSVQISQSVASRGRVRQTGARIPERTLTVREDSKRPANATMQGVVALPPAWLVGRRIWQLTVGDAHHNWIDTSLKWNVLLLGLGNAGPWPECGPILKKAGLSTLRRGDVRRFAEEMRIGDIVVLHIGADKAVAVAEVTGDYAWQAAFGDVDGDDLQHTRRVRWLWTGTEPQKFHGDVFFRSSQCGRTSNAQLREWLASVSVALNADPPAPMDLPGDGKPVSSGAIADHLYRGGLTSEAISRVLKVIGELRIKAHLYEREEPPTEPETITRLVIPLLEALGWAPRKIAVEWRRIDLALFRRLPRINTNLEVIVEAKRHGSGCLMAATQARRYAAKRPHCRRLVVTDGIRYGVYLKEGEAFNLYAYMNLTRLRDSNPVFECLGAAHVLLALTPEGI